MVLALIMAVVGIALLSKAADEFVEGAAGIASILKISPIVVGAVIVGFGTSAPELLVSGIAATGGNADVGVGNIIGSNIANLTLILGSAALLIPLGIDNSVLRREAPLSTLSVLLFAVFLAGGAVVWWEGLILLAALGVALTIIIKAGSAESDEEIEDIAGDDTLTGASIRTVLGLIGTVAGAWLLVEGALRAADELGVSGGFIGLTLVAVGTSLPELVTAVVAARKGEDDLILGNLLGSNLFNSLAVGGVIGVLGNGPLTDTGVAGLENAFMVGVALATVLVMVTRGRFSRPEGVIFLGIFVAFLVLTWLGQADDETDTAAAASGSPALVAATDGS